MTNQMKMVDDRVDFRKCAWYNEEAEHSKCNKGGYDECDEVQAYNCKDYIEL